MTDSITVIAADLPEPPINPPTITAVSQTSVSLDLSPISSPNDGGSAVTGYIVMIDDGEGGTFTQVQDSLVTTLTISNLKTSRSYRIKYAGRNIIYDNGNMFDCDYLKFSPSAVALTAVLPSSPLSLH